MKDNYVKKSIMLMLILFIISSIPLYFLSDRRIEVAKRISYVFDVDISENAKRVQEAYKEPSFHGDGIRAVKLTVKSDELRNISKELSMNKEIKKLDIDNDYIKFPINYLNKEKSFNIKEPKNYEIYSKSKNDKESGINYFANYYLLLIEKNGKEIIFIESDT
ncbi:hypothetical protein ABID14_001473 [Peptoniphilus olsenii]|uniref:DUF4825 domain-containing protein n=1 Tax=Peptoniphilus olsenii TaxID=411570 RepID=A0ABV2JB59_9FIRM